MFFKQMHVKYTCEMMRVGTVSVNHKRCYTHIELAVSQKYVFNSSHIAICLKKEVALELFLELHFPSLSVIT
jgi:hypothetical protein